MANGCGVPRGRIPGVAAVTDRTDGSGRDNRGGGSGRFPAAFEGVRSAGMRSGGAAVAPGSQGRSSTGECPILLTPS
jgi:hypothetical protein